MDRVHALKRAQASLEFLTTYGWAFLIIVTFASVLVYVGVLNPSIILSERCIMGYGFQCLASQVKTSEVRVRLKNNQGETITATPIITTEGGTAIICTTTPGTISQWNPSAVVDLTWSDCTTSLVEGQRAKINLVVSFYPTSLSSAYTKEVQGELASKVINSGNGGGGGGPPASLTCSVAGTCTGFTIFRLSSTDDAHSEISTQTNYNNLVCCTPLTGTLGNSCVTGINLLKLSANTDAHAEQSTQTNYPINVCLSHSTGTVACQYSNSCTSDETCIAEISGVTDAHVGDCNSAFSTKICCKVQ